MRGWLPLWQSQKALDDGSNTYPRAFSTHGADGTPATLRILGTNGPGLACLRSQNHTVHCPRWRPLP